MESRFCGLLPYACVVFLKVSDKFHGFVWTVCDEENEILEFSGI